jgi:hypothetical protein
MPQRIRSKVKFKGDLQPQNLNITNVAPLATASRAKMYNGKIVIDMTKCSYGNASRGVTIGGIPAPIRIIGGNYYPKAPMVGKGLFVFAGQKLGVGSLGTFVRSSISAPGYASAILSGSVGVFRFMAGGQANAVITTGSQICLAGALSTGAGLVVLDYEPYEL